MRDTKPGYDGDVVLGEEYVSPGGGDAGLAASRAERSPLRVNRSPLARKIITFNLIALLILIGGIFWLDPFRQPLALQRGDALAREAALIANAFEVQLPGGMPVSLATGDGIDAGATLGAIDLAEGAQAFVFDAAGTIVAEAEGPALAEAGGSDTVLTDALNSVWGLFARIFTPGGEPGPGEAAEALVRQLVPGAVDGTASVPIEAAGPQGTIFAVAVPIMQGDRTVGVIGLTNAAADLDSLARSEREEALQIFFIAVFVSLGLSLLLASTIANPLSDLAAAAEIGRDRHSRKLNPGRVRIPDLTGRPDEIGRLSGALRGMVAALYDRIDANEQFAADVAHEIKNPLASLRSAVVTLRVAKREDQRDRLLDVIDHDVRRLDRLVSDISNASRLDSELVKEEEESFDLIKMVRNLTDYLGEQARERGVEFITDLPPGRVETMGLEARLAQVFVNLITNAISFCEEGDAVRVWVRRRENRVLVVVEDTGPGIPEQALTKVFNRFYSERPPGQFGDHSGLGLAISKQIVESHGGVIWAENIRPTDADLTSDPLGARFVVGLPI
ncbi:sensor histidine kinase [Tropicimonas sp. IMCC34011]|uniref:sensor histidine kinase n=1 Tax=Tropicimonas sp. IMCC34011 TaxID=2248759 RepID=UPI001E50892C|nr:sensor histidine kinase [Tropicimonas sp. IMCC34011]